jgi:hypothetical protein
MLYFTNLEKAVMLRINGKKIISMQKSVIYWNSFINDFSTEGFYEENSCIDDYM